MDSRNQPASSHNDQGNHGANRFLRWQHDHRLTFVQWLFAHLLIAVTVAGFGICIVRDIERWPFSNFPMFRSCFDDELTTSRFFIVTESGEQLLPGSALKLLGAQNLVRTHARVRNAPDRDQRLAKWSELVVKCLHNSGTLNQKRFRKATRVRLYRLHWKVKPRASNREAPDERELLWEIPLAPAVAGESVE